MSHDELDRMLLGEREIVPSSGFVTNVMDAVRREASTPPPIPFPWKWALRGLAAWTGVLVLFLMTVWAQVGAIAPEATVLDGAKDSTGAANGFRFSHALDAPGRSEDVRAPRLELSARSLDGPAYVRSVAKSGAANRGCRRLSAGDRLAQRFPACPKEPPKRRLRGKTARPTTGTVHLISGCCDRMKSDRCSYR
jgi:hypothetical protein